MELAVDVTLTVLPGALTLLPVMLASLTVLFFAMAMLLLPLTRPNWMPNSAELPSSATAPSLASSLSFASTLTLAFSMVTPLSCALLEVFSRETTTFAATLAKPTLISGVRVMALLRAVPSETTLTMSFSPLPFTLMVPVPKIFAMASVLLLAVALLTPTLARLALTPPMAGVISLLESERNTLLTFRDFTSALFAVPKEASNLPAATLTPTITPTEVPATDRLSMSASAMDSASFFTLTAVLAAFSVPTLTLATLVASARAVATLAVTVSIPAEAVRT